MPERIKAARRIVVKIGSSLLVDRNTGILAGTLNWEWVRDLAADIARMRERGQEVVVVSSGAIALGRQRLKFDARPLRLEEKQAAAAAGQVSLAHAYEEALKPYDVTVAQVLLTVEDTEERRRYLNARGTVNTLLELGALPLINENDTVATSEIRYGDNDRLAARVALMVSADCLVLLSDVDGLYSKDPSTHSDADFIPEVDQITPEITAMAGAAQTLTGTGGMVTKIEAAKMALAGGCHVAITSGKVRQPLKALEDGGRCTWFVPRSNPRVARKQWIGASLRPTGRLIVDAGAALALTKGKSLLPAGVAMVEGDFERGDAVVIADADGRELGRGLCAYSATDARRIIGHKSGEIEAVLGYRGRDEMVHRDDLAL